MVGNNPLTNWSQLFQLSPPFNLIATSSIFPLRRSGKGPGAGKRESLAVLQVLFSSSQNTVVLSALFQAPIQNAIWAAVMDANSIPTRPRTVLNQASWFVQEESKFKCNACWDFLLLLGTSLPLLILWKNDALVLTARREDARRLVWVNV